jgi:hypothetical protein
MRLVKNAKRGQIMDLLKFCSGPGDDQGKKAQLQFLL